MIPFLAATAAAAFAALNVAAFFHARAMTHFLKAGTPTPHPDELGWPSRLLVLLGGVRIPKPANDRTPSDVGLTYRTGRIAAPGGGRLEMWTIPSPRPRGVVAMFHGYGGCKARMLDDAAIVRRLGWTVVLPDFRGSGGSSGGTTSVGWHEAADVAAVERAVVRRTRRPPVLLGVSMGAAAILRAVAVHGVRPRAVVLEAPFDRLVTTVGNRFRLTGLPAWPFAPLLVFWGGVQLGFDALRHRPVDWAAAVRCPALVVTGARDRRARPAEVRRVFRRLRGPRRFRVLPHSGHDDHSAETFRLWGRAVSGFLRGLPAQERRAGGG